MSISSDFTMHAWMNIIKFLVFNRTAVNEWFIIFIQKKNEIKPILRNERMNKFFKYFILNENESGL